MSFIYSYLFPAEYSPEPIVETPTPAPIPEPIVDPIIALLERCNEKWLRPRGFLLERDSNVCYILRSSSKNETHILYVKPTCYPGNNVQYDIGNRELYYPHLQTSHRLEERMVDYGIEFSVIDRSTIQIGKESQPFYLYIKGTELCATDTITDTFSGLSS